MAGMFGSGMRPVPFAQARKGRAEVLRCARTPGMPGIEIGLGALAQLCVALGESGQEPGCSVDRADVVATSVGESAANRVAAQARKLMPDRELPQDPVVPVVGQVGQFAV
jgi:hypothetical protein